ncbi:MAG TPA: NAD(P)H-binding protein [Candidatus Acidoferrales bacterium]|nr:NAD(P)H-binding protein [Candidatus Acidoferrales bacterium]
MSHRLRHRQYRLHGPRLGRAATTRGHRVRALVRPGSGKKAPPDCEVVAADPLNASTFLDRMAGCDTLVQLLGVTHPNPRKVAEFRAIDLGSALTSLEAARQAHVAHFVYVSVAQPAPVMQFYIQVRAEVEAAIRAAGINATFIRPWYVLGPGRRWPLILVPMYWIFEKTPTTRDSARRLGLVTREQMIAALVNAVENPPAGVKVVEVPEIRNSRL